jgi:hypothetical protein
MRIIIDFETPEELGEYVKEWLEEILDENKGFKKHIKKITVENKPEPKQK